LAHLGSGSVRFDERKYARNERNGGHEDRTQPQAAASIAASAGDLPSFCF
jgi:hypothetical protein